MLRRAAAGWQEVMGAMAVRERGLLKLSDRIWLQQACCAVAGWQEVAVKSRRERVGIRRLLDAMKRRLASSAMGGFISCVESSRALGRASGAAVGRTERSAVCLALGAWRLEGVSLEKRGERVVQEALARHARARGRAAFKAWRLEMARGRRLRGGILLRERRCASNALNAWEEEAARGADVRTRIAQMKARARTRQVEEIVRLWIGVSEAGMRREVGLSRILSRTQWHLLLCSVRGWANVVGNVWESRRREASVARAMERVRVASATRTLREWCRSKLKRRRALAVSETKRLWSSKRKVRVPPLAPPTFFPRAIASCCDCYDGWVQGHRPDPSVGST